jgi:hypothetical protein
MLGRRSFVVAAGAGLAVGATAGCALPERLQTVPPGYTAGSILPE